MTSPEMRETKDYKTYLGYATGVTPPKKARKFKKPASPKLSTVPASPEEPTRKSRRVKRPAKKSSDAPTADDEEEKVDEFVKTPSNSTDDEDKTNVESKVKNKAEGDEDEGMNYTTNQFDDDVNLRMNEPVTTDEGFIQKEVDVSVHHEVPSNQTPTLLTVPGLVITEYYPIFTTVIPQSLPSFTLPSQQSTTTPPPTTEATNPLSTLPNSTTESQHWKKEVVELKKNDPLNTQVTALVDEHLDSRLGATRD
ncbi:hypothetical protein Tco_0661516, partial [Tanacetum coccineum]